MKRLFLIFATVSLLSVLAAAQKVVDRIVATVNGRPVLQSDWEEQARFEALVEGRPLPQPSPASLERVIDQQLLREQMKGANGSVAASDVDEKIAEVRRQTAGATDEAAWREVLARYGMDESDLREHLQAQLDLMRFVDRRLRPSVHVSQKDIEKYYSETFLPQLKQRGAGEAPLAEVSARIEQILAQQQMDEILTTWLKDLRRQGNVRLLVPESKAEIQADSQ